MKCWNPECNSITAQPINISINISEVFPGEEVEYVGYTDYGDPGQDFATSCTGDEDSCERITYAPNWKEIILRAGPSGDDIVLASA